MNLIHPRHAPKKPLGQVTRGKTARNRLRPVDNFFLMYDPGLLTRQDGDFSHALFVDLGYGAEAFTTLETASRFRALNPRLGILGVEIEAERVAHALPFADERTFFRLGGFNIPLKPCESIRAIRAFNVLRQYEEADAAPAWGQMARGVLPGGLLVEGTSNPSGSLLSANVLRRQDDDSPAPWRQEALIFYTNFHPGFNPAEFQTILPKNLIHRMTPGEPIYNFLEAWKASAAESISMRAFGLRSWFAASATGLSRHGYRIRLDKKWLKRGWLLWEFP